MKLSDLDKHRPIMISEGCGFLGILLESGGVGKVVKDVNTTVDVQPGEISRQAAKFGFMTSSDGVPPLAATNGNINTNKKKMGAPVRSHRS